MQELVTQGGKERQHREDTILLVLLEPTLNAIGEKEERRSKF